MSIKKYRTIMRIITTIAIVLQGLYYSHTEPGPMDFLNGAIAALVIYCAWFGREKDV